MELVMNGMTELNEKEMMLVDGGWSWRETVAVCAAVTVVAVATVYSGGTATAQASALGFSIAGSISGDQE